MSLTLVSFDIDGTLECGQPPGLVPLALVRTAKQLGYLVGSCSDRPIGYQQALWRSLGIAVDFTVLKHRLADLKARFARPGAARLRYWITERGVATMRWTLICSRSISEPTFGAISFFQ